ncbi:LamG-like jellyroll fold domain-containing protein [Actinoplanes sp. NPDC049599]|uniref:LamG-like jellyroll fold domain-containing protein n=1 Tax=Actinoplanes sp. NPDC049599 TaxID=3363903 RepID=UPI0037B69710
MRFTAKTASLALAMTALPGIAAPSPALAAPPVVSAPAAVTPVVAAPAAAAAGPVTVARYSFDKGAGATGRVAENSGRGTALTVRAADRGRVTFPGTTDKVASFPAACAATARTCPRALLEGTDDADLDPGTRLFRWGAAVRVTRAQVNGSSNVVQKGVVDTESQWKMQIGAKRGRAHCVVVGKGSAQVYLVRSTVGVADAKWHSIMCQRAGASLTVYVDGQARGRIAIPATLSIANTRPLRIGGPNFNAKSDMFHGQLDDVYARLG